MKDQSEFGKLRDEKPFDFDFGSEGDTDVMMFPDDMETAHVLIEKATADVVAVDTDRDRLKEFASENGFMRTCGIYDGPFGLEADDVEYPNLP